MTTENTIFTMIDNETPDRPFVGAVKQYKLILNKEITNALTHLLKNPTHQYAQVKLALFLTLNVECSNKDGIKSIKKFSMHEAHYGPHRHKKNQINNDNSYFWDNFLNRDTSIWEKINKDDKWLFNGKACSPFRQRQVALLTQGLFLLDASDVVFDETNQKYKYNIDISIYRKLPSNGPFRAKHGYGFIPSIKNIPKVEKKTDQESLKKNIQTPSNNTNVRPIQPYIQQPYIQQPYMQQQYMQQPYMHQPYMQQQYMHQQYMHQQYMHQQYMHQPHINHQNPHRCPCSYMHPPYMSVNSPRNFFQTKVQEQVLNNEEKNVSNEEKNNNDEKQTEQTEDKNNNDEKQTEQTEEKNNNDEKKTEQTEEKNNNEEQQVESIKDTDLIEVMELYSTKWFPTEMVK